MRGYIDVTLPLSETTAPWPGDEPFRLWQTATHTQHGYRVSAFSMSAHLGTHVDAPLHMFENAAAVGDIPPDAFIGRGIVVSADDLPLNRKHARVFVRAKDGLTLSQAESLLWSGLRLIGVSGPSVDIVESLDVHRLLLSRGVPVVENLLLDNAPSGPCHILCLPLPLPHADAAPVRCFIRPMIRVIYRL